MDVLCDSQVLYPHFLQGLLVGSGGNMLQYAFTNHLSVQSLMERLLKDINYQLKEEKKGRKLYWVEHDNK